MLRIANAAGFYGDRIAAAQSIVERTDVDYITFDYLAELTMSILARQREKDPTRGYAEDFVKVVRTLAPALYLQPDLRLVANAGGMNPRRCAEAIGRLLVESGSGEIPIAVVLGDDLLGSLEELLSGGCPLANLDTGAEFSTLQAPTVAANAYLGAASIAEALFEGGRIVITGRIADASLVVGPAIYELGIPLEDYDSLALATVAGHLIECGAQVTGGYTTRPTAWPLTDIGYPIAEFSAPDRIQITKPPRTDGVVNRQTVVEQLVYEVGDPAHYLTPDVDVDLTSVHVEEHSLDRVDVWGAIGNPPPDAYKVSLAYHAGYTATAQLLVHGPDCKTRAEQAADIVLARVAAQGLRPDRVNVELLGTGAGVPGTSTCVESIPEVMVRISVADADRNVVDCFAGEIPPLITTGPAGIAGYAAGRIRTRPVHAYWPTTVPKDLVHPTVEVRSAQAWSTLPTP